MKIGILTSSRADFGIYLPLIRKMNKDSFFEIEIIAFGTHLSKFHGFTISEIENYTDLKINRISSLISNDDEQAISTSYGLTLLKFADFWNDHKYDLVFCLGDRFEMSAAVQAGIPFGMKYAHIHGGETTLGAIDNIYRHQITLASQLHFTSCNTYSYKVKILIGSDKNIFTVGSLSLDEISDFHPVSKEQFFDTFAIPNKDFALVTFHPETVMARKNGYYACEMKKALEKISDKIFLVITMPNADTLGTVYRDKLELLKSEHPKRILLIENFGKANYFSAMHYSKILIGNTSSGIIEAASFGKYVVNIGDRQKGRAKSENIFDAIFNAEDIIDKTSAAIKSGTFSKKNIYYKPNVAENIIKMIKQYA